MNYKERLNVLLKLGEFLRSVNLNPEDVSADIRRRKTELDELIPLIKAQNGWFDEASVRNAMIALGEMLDQNSLSGLIEKYPDLQITKGGRRIFTVMAGNIPLVGFHDMVCTFLTGNILIAKTSAKDKILPEFIVKILTEINSDCGSLLHFSDHLNEKFDVVIATGSDNSSRYFEYYFSKYPNIIRKNRSSVAIIEGNESKEDLQKLGGDIFSFYGLGCRNVSKVYIPLDYDITKFIDSLESFSYVANNHKYANNYEYSRSIFLMNRVAHLDNGFLLFREDASIHSPIAVLHYERYKTLEVQTMMEDEDIQCIASRDGSDGLVPFGKTQNPSITDFADGIDTLKFLLHL